MVIPRKIVSFVIELNYSNTMYGKMKEFLSQTLAEIKEAGLYKEERLIESAQQAAITVKGKEVLNFCANNYLGLSNHPRLIKASQEMMERRGFGMSSVRFICGTQDIQNGVFCLEIIRDSSFQFLMYILRSADEADR